MKSILIIDDNKLNLATARTVLSNEYKVIPVMKGQQALTYLENNDCDIVLLDIYMPDMDGFEVLERIRKIERCSNIPVIFLTADSDAETETRCFKAGAVDFIAKPFVPEVMMSRVSRALELEELRRNLADMLEQKTKEVSDIMSRAQKDALTGLWDRSYTEAAVNQMMEQKIPGALLMMDVDNFKAVNDTYGHDMGDKMLQAIADILVDTAAEGDVLCRLGGDEYMVAIRDVTAKDQMRDRAVKIINRVGEKIREMGFDVMTSISIGIAQMPEDGADFAAIYSCADKALYYVKRNGKNAYHFYGDNLRDESQGKELVDIGYLQEFMSRADSNGRGAYFLDVGSFRDVYNFIRRFIVRSKNEVTMMLFTLRDNENEEVIQALEETVCNSLRRSDVAARYSTKQTIIVLMDANRENSQIAADRILNNFYRKYERGTVQIDYDIASLDRPKEEGQNGEPGSAQNA